MHLYGQCLDMSLLFSMGLSTSRIIPYESWLHLHWSTDFYMTCIIVLFFYQVFLLSLNISSKAYKETHTGNLPKSDPLHGPSSETKQFFSSRKQEGVWLSLLVKGRIANHHPPIHHLAYVHLQRKNRGLMWKAKVTGWMNTLVSCRQVGGECKLSSESSLRRCRTLDGLICSGRGECECGICICQVTEPGTFYGPRCGCHDWICPTYDGKTCGGKSCLTLSQHSIPTQSFTFLWMSCFNIRCLLE